MQFTPATMPPHAKTSAVSGVAVFDGEGAFALRVSDQCEVRGKFDDKLKAGNAAFPIFRGKGTVKGKCTSASFDPKKNEFALAMRNLCGEISMEFVANGEINSRKGETVGTGLFIKDDTIVKIQEKAIKQRERDAAARQDALKKKYGDNIPQSELEKDKAP